MNRHPEPRPRGPQAAPFVVTLGALCVDGVFAYHAGEWGARNGLLSARFPRTVVKLYTK